MFTGIVQLLAPVIRADRTEHALRFGVSLGSEHALTSGLTQGASIAINGTCLTVVGWATEPSGDTHVYFDVMAETLARTNIGALRLGDRVDAERSLKFGDEIGGHLVSGHVDCAACIEKIEHEPNYKIYFRIATEEMSKFLVQKGYITVDGASLTVVDVEGPVFSVCLIPETLSRTTLGFKKAGDTVNIEFETNTKTTVETIERILPSMLAAKGVSC